MVDLNEDKAVVEANFPLDRVEKVKELISKIAKQKQGNLSALVQEEVAHRIARQRPEGDKDGLGSGKEWK